MSDKFVNLASVRFGTEDNSNGDRFTDRHPYLKYTWTVSFVFPEYEGCSGGQISDITPKTVELPRWTAETQVVHAYNHKTIVQTKLNFEPITISFYDQQNNATESLIWSYVKAQFDVPDASKAAKHLPLTVIIKQHKTSSGPISEDSQKTYILYPAYITDATHDTLDYGQSDVVLWTITLRYEELQMLDCGFVGETPEEIVTGSEFIPSSRARPFAGETDQSAPPDRPRQPDAAREDDDRVRTRSPIVNEDGSAGWIEELVPRSSLVPPGGITNPNRTGTNPSTGANGASVTPRDNRSLAANQTARISPNNSTLGSERQVLPTLFRISRPSIS